MKKLVILLAERDGTLPRYLYSLLRSQGAEVIISSDSTSLLRALCQQSFDLIFADLAFDSAGDGIGVVQLLRQCENKAPIIGLATKSSEELAIAALRAGVADYLRPPFSQEEIWASVRRCLAQVGQPEPSTDKEILSRSYQPPRNPELGTDCHGMVGESVSMQEIKTYLLKIAATESNTLITGETGTGKELVAALIHKNSRRRQKPFVCINCAAVPDNLLESELFGYERGAFTGAHALKEGKLKLADGGTVFFDEIGDMSPYAQAKILRAIESKAVDRLGGKKSISLDIRVIAATNRNLEQLMTEEKFRPDLYFRLNVAGIHLPPLRERKEDLPALCNFYINDMNRRFGQDIEGLSEEALTSFLHYNWPGNVRELRNLLEAAFVNRPSQKISFADLPQQFRKRLNAMIGLPQDERDQLLNALLATNWNKSLAAQKLHWSRMTLYRKMVKYHVVSGGKSVQARKRELKEPPPSATKMTVV